MQDTMEGARNHVKGYGNFTTRSNVNLTDWNKGQPPLFLWKELTEETLDPSPHSASTEIVSVLVGK